MAIVRSVAGSEHFDSASAAAARGSARTVVGGREAVFSSFKNFYKSGSSLTTVDPLSLRHKILSQQLWRLRLSRWLAQGRSARVKISHEKMVSRRCTCCLSTLEG